MHIRYENRAHQFLSAYRFVSYALAVMFTELGPPLAAPIPELQLYIIFAALGAYILLRSFSKLRWREGSPITYVILIGDFVLAMLLILYTNGLNSYFLLYSLTPIMTAGLFFHEKVAVSLAAAASVFLSVTHLILSDVIIRFTWLMQGYNLTLLIIYTLFCFVAATVPYRINFNVRRRIEYEAITQERRRIAREMHDGIAQALAYLNVKTSAVGDSIAARNSEKALNGLSDIRSLVRDTYEDIRESIEQLSVESRTGPITQALAKYAAKFGKDTKINVKLDSDGSATSLSPVAELQMLRIAQEALTNVRRHAGASEVAITLGCNNRKVEMILKDNGCGFRIENQKDLSGYHGINIIRERAEGLGGSAEIISAPGKGTEVRVSFPTEKVRL